MPVAALAGAARTYWLEILPYVDRDLRHWRVQASRIPDPELRRHALVNQREERGNLEGAAAFAMLAPAAGRARVVRAAVAFQVLYDYVDTLAELPSGDPAANGRELHAALLTALDPAAEHGDYYRHSLHSHDGGYIRSLTEACRQTLTSLPSYAPLAGDARRAARRMVVYQSLNHIAVAGDRDDAQTRSSTALARWATEITPAHTGLRWWETAAGAASSLNVFPLFAAAAGETPREEETQAMRDAYFPWIGALHVLLDSLVDAPADSHSGEHSLVGHYSSVEEAAARMGAIARRAFGATATVAQPTVHALLLAAMAGFYLSAPGARTPSARPVARQVLDALGALAAPAMTLLRARKCTIQLLARVKQ